MNIFLKILSTILVVPFVIFLGVILGILFLPGYLLALIVDDIWGTNLTMSGDDD